MTLLCFENEQPTAELARATVLQGRRNNEAGGALCVEVGFYADISWESRHNIEINVWAHFNKILLAFEVPYRPRVNWMPEKS